MFVFVTALPPGERHRYTLWNTFGADKLNELQRKFIREDYRMFRKNYGFSPKQARMAVHLACHIAGATH